VFPRPEKFRVAGRLLRSRLERLAPETLVYSRNAGRGKSD
jgi:hypothetical protein